MDYIYIALKFIMAIIMFSLIIRFFMEVANRVGEQLRFAEFFVYIWRKITKSQPQSSGINQYDGRALSIGIIGEVPKVQEEQIKFTTIQFSDLENGSVSQYDAIFIIEDNMKDGTQVKYTTFCKDYQIPFFFSKMERLGDNQTFATGFLDKPNMQVSWSYGLPNNIENEKNIKDIFSQIFETISQNIIPKKN
ncbi:MAG TPA: hypothetical protein VIK78_10585 [Ruminiclostridium sp.]